jgi:hypothetical protein
MDERLIRMPPPGASGQCVGCIHWVRASRLVADLAEGPRYRCHATQGEGSKVAEIMARLLPMLAQAGHCPEREGPSFWPDAYVSEDL